MAEQQRYRKVKRQPQSTGVMAYLDGLLTALDPLYLSLGQGDPLLNGLQLPPTQLNSLGDPAQGEKWRLEHGFRFRGLWAPVPTSRLSLAQSCPECSTQYNLPIGLVSVLLFT